MRIAVEPGRADVTPGVPTPFTLTIANTSSVIGGYAIRILGADPGWVELETDEVSLFPDESRTIGFTVTPPTGIMAGARRIAVQVRELTPPESTSVVELDLSVPSSPSTDLRVDPLTVTAGRHAPFSLVVANRGNTQVERRLAGDDPEDRVKFRFDPPLVSLSPGEHAVVDLRATARRPFLGSPRVRMLSLYLDPPSSPDDDRTFARDEREAVGLATFIQKPVVSRGGISLFGLLAAVTVFGLVITLALTRLVGQSAQDRDLALQVAAARNSSATTGTSSASGTVRLLTSGKPVAGVSVSLYSTDNDAAPLASTATNDQGSYTLPNLPAGSYKVSFRGAGFVQLWYPGTPNQSDATQIQLTAAQQRTGLDVNLGGVPATISGTVSGDDVSAATLYLETAPLVDTTIAVPGGPAGVDTSAIVKTVPIGADGTFTLTDVPSPSVYQIRVVKPGYATSVQRIDIGAGEDRKGVQIALRKGDGLVSGKVTTGAGPLGGVTITATAGQSTANTVSLTERGAEGTFTLQALPTPASITLVASKAGYASQTLTLTLAPGQKLTGVSITLARSSGSLEGVVSLVKDGARAPGVSVSATNGSLTVTSHTESTDHVGFWQLGGLPVPGTYTVTFSRADLVSQTISVSLDGAGNITPGSFGAQITDKGIAVSMQAAWATVWGTVSQRTSAAGSGSQPIGEATITLTSGSVTYTTTTASTPSGSVGEFRLENLPPGTYTVSVNRPGTSPTSTIMTLRAGQVAKYEPLLDAAASITGLVRGTDGGPVRAGWTVELYEAAQYPSVLAATTKTDTTGRFTFPSVDAPQAYVIVVRPTSGSAQAASRTVQIEPSEQLGSATDSNPLYRNLVIEADPDE